MKYIRNITKSMVLMAFVFFTSSCEKWIDPSINDDPNNPIDAPMSLIIPTAEAGMAYNFGGDIGRTTSIWMQQIAGVDQQAVDQDKYIFGEYDTENEWKYNLYAGAMMDINNIMIKAAADNSPWYGGIAKVLMAQELGTVTDLWGNAPYSQAFLGNDQSQPAYDSQQELYVTIQRLLDEAITAFATTADQNVFAPGSEDHIYSGDIALWNNAAHMLKARYHLHLSKVDNNSYSKVLADLEAGGFTSNNDDFQYNFGSSYNENNPNYQFLGQRPGYIAMGKFLVDKLIADNDPRIPAYMDTTGGNLHGSPAGDADPTATTLGDGDAVYTFFTGPTSPVIFASYVEQKFIEAEARFQTNDLAGAATAFNEAVVASLAKVGASDNTWEGVHAAETSATITLAKIMDQKYIALYMNPEAFNDWRRTGLPALTPALNAATPNGQIPRRFPYPAPERLYNSANLNAAVSSQGFTSLESRVWWDALSGK
jgi:hypothetical protein